MSKMSNPRKTRGEEVRREEKRGEDLRK